MNNPTVARRKFLGVGVGTLAAGLALAACSTTGTTAGTAGTTGASANQQDVTMYVFRGETGVKGPDGNGHDAFVPSSFVVKAGVPVQLTVINNDEGPHTITSPEMGLNIMINPGKSVGEDVQPVTTTATFTPAKKGVYRWFCTVQCDGGGKYWAMSAGPDGPSQDGFMAGHIVVI